MDADSRIQVLTHQNQRLAAQLEEKRRDTKLLEDKVSGLEAREAEYAQTLLCVNRLWSQLNADIQHLAAQAGAAGPPPAAAADAKPSASHRDPFLSRLLAHAAGGGGAGAGGTGEGLPTPRSVAADTRQLDTTLKHLEARRSEVEDALHARAAATQSALARVLDAIHALHAQRAEACMQEGGDDDAMHGGGDQSAAAGAAAVQKGGVGGAAEVAGLRQALSAGHAAQRTLAEQLRLAEDRLTEAEEQIKRLQNELADTEQQLSSTQRKYATLKEGQLNDQQAQPVKLEAMGSLGAGPGPAAAALAAAAAAATAAAVTGLGPAAVGVAGGDACAEEVATLQKLLDQRTAELTKEKEAHSKTKRDLSESVSRLGDELWVPGTRSYQSLQQEVARLGEALVARGRDVEALARERDEANREAAMKVHLMHSEGQARAKAASLEKAYREACAARMESERGRQELEQALQREREKGGSSQTAAELRAMVATLQGQVEALQQHLKLNQVTQVRLEQCALEAQAAQGRVDAKALEVQRMADRLKRRDLDLEEQRRREQGLKERVHELKAFVEVLTVYCNDPRELAEVRASEAALREQVAGFKTQLQGHPLQQRIRELEAAEAASRDQQELRAMEADELRLELARLQGMAEELQVQLSAARAECQLYISEMETMGSAYEDMQAQNSRLLQKLTEKDEAHNQLLAERLKLLQGQHHLQEQLELKHQEAERHARDAADANTLKEGLEKEVTKLTSEVVALKESVRLASSRAESALLELRRREEAAALHAVQLEGLQKQLADARAGVEAADEKLVKEKAKRQKVEDDSKLLTTKLERLRKAAAASGGGAAGVRELQEEVDAMRQLLNCNVCHERQKNVIITKCCHVFCDKCIKRNLESRNRKCPGCGVPFGQADVKPFYYT